MAKTDRDAIIRLCNDIVKKNGKGSIYTLNSSGENLNIPRWSTGLAELDEILGGGMPEGRTVEIFGEESSGKTTLVYHLCAQHELCLDLPVEGSFDKERAKIFGNRARQMLIYRESCGEDAFNKMMLFSKKGIPLICVDSVPSLIPSDDSEKLWKGALKDTIEEQRIGGTARLLTKYLPELEKTIDMTGTTVVFVNQVRDRMNAMPFGEKIDTPGGHKARHSYSVRIRVARKAWIKIPNKNPLNSAENEIVGFIMKCKIVKSKICNPLGECELPCFFDRGFVTFDDIPNIRKELMEDRRKRYVKGAVKSIEGVECD